MTMKTRFKTRIAIAALAGFGAAGLAQAQSHSVVNYSNPPNAQADSKAATDATPGLTATADQQDANHPGKGAKDAAANRSNAAGGKVARSKTKGPQRRPASSAAAKDQSQTATASVALDGASKGGAEATMQAEPSQAGANDSARHAFDSTPSKK